MGIRALEENPIDEREIRAVTLAISKNKAAQAKNEVKK